MTDTSQCPIVPERGIIIITSLEYKTPGKLVTADSLKEQDLAGLVVSVGGEDVNEHGVKLTTPIKIGDKIIHRTLYQAAYKYNNNYYKFVKFSEVLGVINE